MGRGFAFNDKSKGLMHDEMMDLISGNYICTINEPSATMLNPNLWFL